MFNLRLTDEQFSELQQLARQRHLPMATMARSWLLDRLHQERPQVSQTGGQAPRWS
jgi:hypothetical protein